MARCPAASSSRMISSTSGSSGATRSSEAMASAGSVWPERSAGQGDRGGVTRIRARAQGAADGVEIVRGQVATRAQAHEDEALAGHVVADGSDDLASAPVTFPSWTSRDRCRRVRQSTSARTSGSGLRPRAVEHEGADVEPNDLAQVGGDEAQVHAMPTGPDLAAASDQQAGDAVEDPVDEGGGVLAAVAAGDLDGLVDRGPGGNVRAGEQPPAAEAQEAPFEGADTLEAPVGAGLADQLVDLFPPRDDVAGPFVQLLLDRSLGQAALVAFDGGIDVGAADVDGVEHAHDGLAEATAAGSVAFG